MSTTSIIDKLKEIRDKNLVEVFVPSSSTVFKFKQLNLKQQKDLIKTGLEGALSGIYLDNVINDIITSNSTTDYSYLITDKLPIILGLRAASLGTICKIEEKSVDFKPLLERQLSFEADAVKQLDFNGLIHVNLTVPTIEKDVLTNKAQLLELSADKDLKVSDAIGSLYVYEIVKFIDSVKIGDEVLSFKSIQVKDMVKVVESLPATLNNEVIKFIQSFRAKENEYLTLNDNTIAVDARFFTLDS